MIAKCKEDFLLFASSEADFSRDRDLPLEHLVGCLLYKSASSKCGYELLTADYFWHLEKCNDLTKISRSSFSEARDKLSWEAFAYLLDEVSLEHLHSSRWKGHEVFAVDGTSVLLPKSEELLETFPLLESHFGKRHYPEAKVLGLANAFTGQILKLDVFNKHIGERDVLRRFIPSLNKNSILILDRGFHSPALYSELDESEIFYVCRIRASLGQKQLASAKEKIIGNVRYIKGPKLKSGEHIYIATNLTNPKKYSRKEILKLFKERQTIEESFLHLKNVFHVSKFNSKKLNGVLQEIFAAAVMTSIATGLRWLLEEKISKNKRVSLKAIALAMKTMADIFDLCEFLVKFGHVRQPNRSYPRYSRQPESKWIKEKRRRALRQKRRSMP